MTISDIKLVVSHIKYNGACRIGNYVIHRYDHDNNGNTVYTIIDSDHNSHVFTDRKKAIRRFLNVIDFLSM